MVGFMDNECSYCKKRAECSPYIQRGRISKVDCFERSEFYDDVPDRWLPYYARDKR